MLRMPQEIPGRKPAGDILLPLRFHYREQLVTRHCAAQAGAKTATSQPQFWQLKTGLLFLVVASSSIVIKGKKQIATGGVF